jgi:hypothetical protein
MLSADIAETSIQLPKQSPLRPKLPKEPRLR